MTNYGTTTHNGLAYMLTDDARLTNRLLPGGYINYHEADDGEVYDFEMSANAERDGNKYIVYWLFEGLKGDDDPELDSYDYSAADRVVAI